MLSCVEYGCLLIWCIHICYLNLCDCTFGKILWFSQIKALLQINLHFIDFTQSLLVFLILGNTQSSRLLFLQCFLEPVSLTEVVCLFVLKWHISASWSRLLLLYRWYAQASSHAIWKGKRYELNEVNCCSLWGRGRCSIDRGECFTMFALVIWCCCCSLHPPSPTLSASEDALTWKHQLIMFKCSLLLPFIVLHYYTLLHLYYTS